MGYIDSGWSGNAMDKKSTSGCCFNLRSRVVSWFSRKQKSMALNSIESKYMAASLMSCEAIWLDKMLTGLFGQELDPTIIYYDNQSCIKFSENPLFHESSKHIEIKCHLIKDSSHRGVMKLQYISINEKMEDILTKRLLMASLCPPRTSWGWCKTPSSLRGSIEFIVRIGASMLACV